MASKRRRYTTFVGRGKARHKITKRFHLTRLPKNVDTSNFKKVEGFGGRFWTGKYHGRTVYIGRYAYNRRSEGEYGKQRSEQIRERRSKHYTEFFEERFSTAPDIDYVTGYVNEEIDRYEEQSQMLREAWLEFGGVEGVTYSEWRFHLESQDQAEWMDAMYALDETWADEWMEQFPDESEAKSPGWYH